MEDAELLNELEAQRALMISVATGGPRIQEVNSQYVQRRDRLAKEFCRRGLDEPNPHGDLWAWYGRWTLGDLPSWASRRTYVGAMYQGLIDQISAGPNGVTNRLFEEATGWPRVDRGIYEIRRRLEQAETEEQFQAIGLLCREALISLAQVVYDNERHRAATDIAPSDTDAKRMLDAFFATETPGSENEGARRYAKAALSLANELQHRRTADHRQATLCAEATTSVINLAAIISGRRDRRTPSPR